VVFKVALLFWCVMLCVKEMKPVKWVRLPVVGFGCVLGTRYLMMTGEKECS